MIRNFVGRLLQKSPAQEMPHHRFSRETVTERTKDSTEYGVAGSSFISFIRSRYLMKWPGMN